MMMMSFRRFLFLAASQPTRRVTTTRLATTRLTTTTATVTTTWKKSMSVSFSSARYLTTDATQLSATDALFVEGQNFWLGKGVKKNLKVALELLERAAKEGHVDANFSIGRILTDGLDGIPRDNAKAFIHYKIAADNGHKFAQQRLGFMYQNGYGTPQNKEEALRFYKLAADRGISAAQHSVAVMSWSGACGEVDAVQAFKYFQMAAEQGHVKALFSLGVFHRHGHGGAEKNDVKAFSYFKKAADFGDVEAQYFTGRNYSMGYGVKVNEEKALHYYMLAADKSHLNALFSLHLFFKLGTVQPTTLHEGVGTNQEEHSFNEPLSRPGVLASMKDASRSLMYGRQAADLGHPRAQFSIGIAYRDGDGVIMDRKLAFKYLTMAANQQFSPGMYELGLCYLNGIGCEVDKEKAANLLSAAKRTYRPPKVASKFKPKPIRQL